MQCPKRMRLSTRRPGTFRHGRKRQCVEMSREHGSIEGEIGQYDREERHARLKPESGYLERRLMTSQAKQADHSIAASVKC